MRTKIYNGLKILGLVLVLSVGVSYVSAAWVTPGTPPPGGNVPAPINTSAKSQTKAGDLTVQNFTANGAATVNGYLTAADVYLSSVNKWASQLGGSGLIQVSSTIYHSAGGGNFTYTNAQCPSGYTVTGCGGYYGRTCWGNDNCNLLGVQIWGNGCRTDAWAWTGSDYFVSEASCMKN